MISSGEKQSDVFRCFNYDDDDAANFTWGFVMHESRSFQQVVVFFSFVFYRFSLCYQVTQQENLDTLYKS